MSEYTGKIQIGENKVANTEGFTVVTDTTKTPGKFFYEEFQDKERAQELVRRWNAFEEGGGHDALLKACKAAEEDLNNGNLCDANTCPHDECTLAILRAAIAEGKKLEK